MTPENEQSGAIAPLNVSTTTVFKKAETAGRDYRNNVLNNWGYESCYGGEAHQKGDRRKPPIEFSTINMVANSDGQGDSDKDGYTNLEEFLNGTNPTEFVD